MSGIIFHSMPNEKNELTDNTVGHLSSHIEAMVNGKIFISNRIASCVNFIFKIYFSLSLSFFLSIFGKVVDENEKMVPFGTPGELWVRGYSNMIEYYNDEEATRKTFTKDGWFKTGDQFILRSDGYGQIVGRLKEMIIRGGENIFPKVKSSKIDSRLDFSNSVYRGFRRSRM